MAMGTGNMGKLALLTGIMKNSRSLKSKFGFQNGYFGKRGKGRKSSTRNIPSQNPLQTAKDFFDTLVQDAVREVLKKDGEPYGYRVDLPDGSISIFRPASHSADKSPAISIDTKGCRIEVDIRVQKIHFTLEVPIE